MAHKTRKAEKPSKRRRSEEFMMPISQAQYEWPSGAKTDANLEDRTIYPATSKRLDVETQKTGGERFVEQQAKRHKAKSTKEGVENRPGSNVRRTR